MLSELFDTLREHFKQVTVPTKIDTGDGRTFYNKDLTMVKPARPPCLTLSTLQGLADYVKANKDGLTLDQLTIQVEDHANVALWSKVDSLHKDRALLAKSQLMRNDTFQYGKWLDQETFSIEVQAKIEDSSERRRLLTLVAAIDVSAGKTVTDNGVAQSIATRAGISMKAEQEVENPFDLAPYRTFSEVVQPESPYILRVRQDAGGAPSLALFEADGGKWKLQAMERIARFLVAAVPTDVSVIA